MKDRRNTLGGKAGRCHPCMMKPLRPPNYWGLRGGQSSLHESNSRGKVTFPLHSEHTEVSSLFPSAHKSWQLNLPTGASWMVEPPEVGRVRALGVHLLLWGSNGSAVDVGAPEESPALPHVAGHKDFPSCSRCVLEWTGWEKVPGSGTDSLFLAQQSPLSLPGTFAQDLIKRLL